MPEVCPVRHVCLPRRSQICTKYGDIQAPDARKEPHGENFKDPTLCPSSLRFVSGHGGGILMPASCNSLFALQTAFQVRLSSTNGRTQSEITLIGMIGVVQLCSWGASSSSVAVSDVCLLLMTVFMMRMAETDSSSSSRRLSSLLFT